MRRTPEQVAAAVAALAATDRAGLVALWRTLYRSEPPIQISRDLLMLAVAYRLQERALGGLKPHVRRALERAAEDLAAGRPVGSAPRFKPGTRLLREWNGVTHQVEIAQDGVLYRGERYRSLSEVARLITGTRWSGPLFFGLKDRRRAA